MLTLPVVSGGKSGRMILDVHVRGLHVGEAAAKRSVAASFLYWRAVSDSLGLRCSTYPHCCLGLLDQMCCPLALAHLFEDLMTKRWRSHIFGSARTRTCPVRNRPFRYPPSARPSSDYPQRKLLFLNEIYNSVCVLANTILLLSRKFFMARRSRIFRSVFKCRDVFRVFCKRLPNSIINQLR